MIIKFKQWDIENRNNSSNLTCRCAALFSRSLHCSALNTGCWGRDLLPIGIEKLCSPPLLFLLTVFDDEIRAFWKQHSHESPSLILFEEPQTEQLQVPFCWKFDELVMFVLSGLLLGNAIERFIPPINRCWSWEAEFALPAADRVYLFLFLELLFKLSSWGLERRSISACNCQGITPDITWGLRLFTFRDRIVEELIWRDLDCFKPEAILITQSLLVSLSGVHLISVDWDMYGTHCFVVIRAGWHI